MEISSVASQAMAVRENMSQIQLGIAAVKQAAQAQEKIAEMLAQKGTTVPPADESESGRLDTYA